jgi:hypothetical protein
VEWSFVISLATRFVIDVACLLGLLAVLRRRRSGVPEMAAVVVALNLGLFAAVVVIGVGDFPAGIGFGLFGLLSLVRLRSAAFTLADVSYTFVALVLALVNGLPERSLWLLAALDAVLLGAVVLVGAGGGARSTRVLRLTLDRAVTEPADLRRIVAERFAATPLSVTGIVIDELDLVRDTTRIAVHHVVDDAGHWPDASGDWGGDPVA